MLLGSKFGCVLLRMMVLKIANLQSKKYPSRPGLGASIKYVHKIFRKTNISNPLIRRLKCAYQGVRNISFSENFDLVRQLQPKDSATNQKMFQLLFLEFSSICLCCWNFLLFVCILWQNPLKKGQVNATYINIDIFLKALSFTWVMQL